MKTFVLLLPIGGVAAYVLLSPAPERIEPVATPAPVVAARAPAAQSESIQALRDRAAQAPEQRTVSRVPGIGLVEHDSKVSAMRSLGGMGQGQATTPVPSGSQAARVGWGWEAKSPLDPPQRR